MYSGLTCGFRRRGSLVFLGGALVHSLLPVLQSALLAVTVLVEEGLQGIHKGDDGDLEDGEVEGFPYTRAHGWDQPVSTISCKPHHQL